MFSRARERPPSPKRTPPNPKEVWQMHMVDAANLPCLVHYSNVRHFNIQSNFLSLFPSSPFCLGLSPYFCFMREERPSLVAGRPGLKIGEVTKVLAARWNKLGQYPLTVSAQISLSPFKRMWPPPSSWAFPSMYSASSRLVSYFDCRVIPIQGRPIGRNSSNLRTKTKIGISRKWKFGRQPSVESISKHPRLDSRYLFWLKCLWHLSLESWRHVALDNTKQAFHIWSICFCHQTAPAPAKKAKKPAQEEEDEEDEEGEEEDEDSE